jgi:hypothetical protein
MEVKHIPENVQVIQIILNAAIIYLVKEVMEEQEHVRFHVVEILLPDNAQEVLISNAASAEVVEEMMIIMDHAEGVVELA